MADKLKNLNKLCVNFSKMLSEENCEMIKINYWAGLENQIKTFNLDNESSIKIIFEEILKKNLDLLSEKNLLFCVINFLSNLDEFIFLSYFYEYLNIFLQNYEENKPVFKDFLAELSLNLFFIFQKTFDNNLVCFENIKKYFISLVNIDPLLLALILKNKVEFSSQNSLLSFISHKQKMEILLEVINKLQMIDYDSFLFFFSHLFHEIINISNIKDIQENLSEFFMSVIRQFIHRKSRIDADGFFDNHIYILCMIKIISCLLLFIKKSENFSNFIFLGEVEKFLVFVLEHILEVRKLFFEYLFLFLEFYQLNTFIKFNNNFELCVFYFSSETFDISSLEIIIKTLNILLKNNKESHKTKIFAKIFLKSIQSSQKIKYLENNPEFKDIQNLLLFQISLKGTNNKLINSSKDFDFTNSFKNISHLNLISYLIDSSFIYSEPDPSKESQLNFYSQNFIENLQTLLTFRLESYNQEFYHFVLKFSFQLISSFADCFQVDNKTTLISSLFFEILFKELMKCSDKIYLKNDIYPLVLSYVQGFIFSNINLFLQNEESNLIRIVFDFLFIFSSQDSVGNLLSKLLSSMFNLKNTQTYKNKELAVELFSELCLRTNSGKIFQLFFNFCLENLKQNDLKINNIIYLNLYIFASKNERAIPSSFLDFVYSRFEKIIDQQLPEIPEDIMQSTEMLFVLNCTYLFLREDNPENIENKIYEALTNNRKILKIFDKILKNFKNDETMKINLTKSQEQQILKIKSLQNSDYREILAPFLIQNILSPCYHHVEHTFQNNFNISIGILISFSKLFSLFMSNLVVKNKQFFDMKNLSDQNNVTITSIIKTYDYITCNILFEEDKDKSFVHVLFLNEFFSQFENLYFFYNTHSYFMAINHLEANNLDFSNLHDVNTKVIFDKNKKIMDFIKFEKNNIFILGQMITNILRYEVDLMLIVENRKYNTQINFKNFVVENLTSSSSSLSENFVNNKILSHLNENPNLHTFFIKDLLEFIYNTSNSYFEPAEPETESLKSNQYLVLSNVYTFLLFEKAFTKYFKNIKDLISFDIVLLNYYVVFKNFQNNWNIKNNFLFFLTTYSKMNKSVYQFTLRILLNWNIFKSFLQNGEIGSELVTMIDYLITQLLFYNSYKQETCTYVETILNNFEKTISQPFEEIKNLKLYGKILYDIYVILTTSQNFEENSHNRIEINKKCKENILTMLNETILINYLKKVFSISSNSDFLSKVSENLFLYFDNYDTILNLKGLKIISETSRNEQLREIREQPLCKYMLMFSDVSFPRVLFIILSKLCESIQENSENDVFVNILENYIIYHIIHKQNVKLLYDTIKCLLLNKEMSDKKVPWKIKYGICSMVVLILLNNMESSAVSGQLKSQNFKALGSLLNSNIIKRLDVINSLFQEVDEVENRGQMLEQYLNSIK